MPTKSGAIRLFQFKGIEVFLHWSWFLVAVWEIGSGPAKRYSSLPWSVAEYLALFLIVLLHEFGHALACRQVGGKANRIVLWPLGGVAYVQPPPRAGANLWSIAAGPLVNVALMPLLIAATYLTRVPGSSSDIHALLRAITFINAGLFVFNILPIYPLDGGQILRSLLWFVIGEGRSLMVATSFGFLGIIALFAFAAWLGSVWIAVIGVFMLMNCWAGLQSARVLVRMAKAPPRVGFRCPACGAAPPVGAHWRCSTCKQSFDTFESQAVCPHCRSLFPTTQCFQCREGRHMSEWAVPSGAAAAPKL
jgi:Zn-dependent protease